MKSEEQIKKRIEEIEKDDRYQSGLENPATIDINAPLAMIQLIFETEVKTLKWVLKEVGVKWQEVASSNIAAIRYYEDSKELHVRFSSGAVYVYSMVSPEVYHDFLTADSKGKYLSARIKGVFECKRV